MTFADIRVTLEYNNVSEEQETEVSSRHVAAGNATLNGETVSDTRCSAIEQQCLDSALKQLSEGILTTFDSHSFLQFTAY